MGVWQAILGWVGKEKRTDGAEMVPIGLLLGLRDAAYDLVTVENEIDEAKRVRPGEDFTQAQLLSGSAKLLKRVADSLIADSSEGSEVLERWRHSRATVLYRAVIDLIGRARTAVARPPGDIRAVKAVGLSAHLGVPTEAEIVDLLELSRQLDEEYAAEIASAQARRHGPELQRLNELLGLLRSRTHLAGALLSRGLRESVGSNGRGQGFGLFNEMFAAWLLVIQELLHPNVTAGLQFDPQSDTISKYAPDNPWMMTDPVAKAKYEHQGRVDEFEQDIRFEVLRGQPFSADDIAFAQQIDWLEQTGVVRRMASYWAVSPHPTIYKAEEAGFLSLADRILKFRRGDQIVWLCQMGMETFDSDVPVLIGNLRSASVRKLCGDMMNAMMNGRSGHTHM